MSWKRTKLSYALWMILVVMTCVVGYYATFGFCVQFGLQGTVILGIYAGVLLFGGLFSVLAFRLKQKWNGKAGEGKILYLILEILFFLAIAGCGIFLRLKYLPNAQPGALYQLSTIRQGETVPDVFAGAEDVYVRILHLICFWFGNTPYFCIRFQLILNVLAGVTWFFAVRKLAGRLPALVFSGFYFLHQFVAYGAVVLSAEWSQAHRARPRPSVPLPGWAASLPGGLGLPAWVGQGVSRFEGCPLGGPSPRGCPMGEGGHG